MSPSSSESRSIDHLISKRAANRSFVHFSTADTEVPANFKPHPSPLAIGLGTPNQQFFPVERVSVTLNEYPFQEQLFSDVAKETTITIDRTYEDEEHLIGAAQAMEYGSMEGAPAFRKLIVEFTETVLRPGYPYWSLIPTTGSGDGLHRVADAVVDVGDVVLMEEFSYIPFINAVRNNGGVPVPIKLDLKKADVDVDYLEQLLENWDEMRPEHKGNRPKAYYTIPTCQNPTGITQLVETRKRIYELAQIYDFVIIEDDPYGYLTLPPISQPDKTKLREQNITVDDYLENHLYPSYLSLDTVGRVIRLDTFSKIFTPGARLGWIVAHKNFIKVIDKYTKVVVRAPLGISQMMIVSIVNQKFGGVRGFLEWILKMRLTYAHRRNVLATAIQSTEAFQKNYIRIISAEAGMFLSLGVNFPEGTDYIGKMKLLNYKFLEHGVLLIQGWKMAVEQEFSRHESNFLRISFAPLNDDEVIGEAAKRIGDAVTEFFENNLEF